MVISIMSVRAPNAPGRPDEMRFKDNLTMCPLQAGRAARDPKCCSACAVAIFWLKDRTGSTVPISPRVRPERVAVSWMSS